MKKLICSILVLILVLCASGLAENLMGGWSLAGDIAVTDAARTALEKAMEGFVGSDIEPVALLATQLVSGTNYCLLCRVTPVVPNPVTEYSLVYVYEALDGHCELIEFDDVEIGLDEADD